MLNQYFGHYLLEKKKLTPEQLAEVMEYERSVRVKLGVLAINSGFMNADQVEIVHHLQRAQDKRFGELAVESGYLTASQLDILLENQDGRHLGLSQAIVDKGYLTLTQLEEVLASYKQDSKPSGKPVPPLEALDFAEADSLGKIYQDYIALIQRNIIRFLDAEPLVGKSEPVSVQPSPWLIYQEITGERKIFTGLTMDGTTLLELARRYSGEVLTEIDELAMDCASEYLNMVNGIFCVNASNEGTELELQLQYVVRDEKPEVKQGYCIPMILPFGKINVIVGTVA